MFRSLHMKLVLIMVLLIVALMTVVGAFLMNSVTVFYLDEFYSDMSTDLTDEQFVRDVTTGSSGRRQPHPQLLCSGWGDRRLPRHL